MRDYKWVTSRQLKKGQVIDEIKTGSCRMSASYTITEANGAFVSYYTFDQKDRIETIPAEGALFKVYLTEEEHKQKWSESADKIAEILKDPISQMSFEDHTMWNGWAECNIWDLAQSLHDHNLELLGWFYLDCPKTSLGGETLNIGLAAADKETGETFWCHYSTLWLEDMMEDYYE